MMILQRAEYLTEFNFVSYLQRASKGLWNWRPPKQLASKLKTSRKPKTSPNQWGPQPRTPERKMQWVF